VPPEYGKTCQESQVSRPTVEAGTFRMQFRSAIAWSNLFYVMHSKYACIYQGKRKIKLSMIKNHAMMAHGGKGGWSCNSMQS
jgi:hypothetical protein